MSQPAFDEPAFDEPAFDEPAFDEPAFDEPAQPAAGARPAEPAVGARAAEPAANARPAEPAAGARAAGPAANARPAEPPAGARQSATAGAARVAPSARPTTYRQPVRRTVSVTGRGVIALILVATVIAGLLDMAISGHRGHLFGVVFAIAAGVGALVVRRRELATAMIAPPLLYCLAILLMSFVDRGGLSGGFLSAEAFYLGNAFVTGAPAVWCGTALACAIGWYRLRRGRFQP